MDILVGSSSAPDRGAGINGCVNQMVDALCALGHQVHYVSPTGKDHGFLSKRDIPHLAAGPGDDPLQTVRGILDYIKRNSIDAVINNDNPFVQCISPAVSCPFIAIGHMASTTIARLACYNCDTVDYVVTLSQDMQQLFTRKYKVPLPKCPIVFNGVSDPGPHGTGAVNNTDLVVAFAGGWSKNKGGPILLQALRSAQNRLQGVELHWFGELPARVKAAIAEIPFVQAHGRVPREVLHEKLANADVLICASRAEGCPMIVLEAMSYRTAPIVSDGKGAMKWLVNSGLNGFVCSLDDWSDQLIDCLEYLRDDPIAREDVKTRAYEHFQRDLRNIDQAKRLLELINRPTVNRTQPSTRLDVLDWHRGSPKPGSKPRLLERISFRAGWLRLAGTIDV